MDSPLRVAEGSAGRALRACDQTHSGLAHRRFPAGAGPVWLHQLRLFGELLPRFARPNVLPSMSEPYSKIRRRAPRSEPELVPVQPRCDFELKRPLHGGMHARIERFRSALNLAGFHNRRLQAGEVRSPKRCGVPSLPIGVACVSLTASLLQACEPCTLRQNPSSTHPLHFLAALTPWRRCVTCLRR